MAPAGEPDYGYPRRQKRKNRQNQNLFQNLPRIAKSRTTFQDRLMTYDLHPPGPWGLCQVLGTLGSPDSLSKQHTAAAPPPAPPAPAPAAPAAPAVAWALAIGALRQPHRLHITPPTNLLNHPTRNRRQIFERHATRTSGQA